MGRPARLGAAISAGSRLRPGLSTGPWAQSTATLASASGAHNTVTHRCPAGGGQWQEAGILTGTGKKTSFHRKSCSQRHWHTETSEARASECRRRGPTGALRQRRRRLRNRSPTRSRTEPSSWRRNVENPQVLRGLASDSEFNLDGRLPRWPRVPSRWQVQSCQWPGMAASVRFTVSS